MRPVGVLYHSHFLLHDMPGHPECAQRLRAVTDEMRRQRERLSFVQDVAFEAATREQLKRVHRGEYLDHLERMSAFGGGNIDGDTYVTDSSFDAAALGAGAAARAVDAVLHGEFATAFALPRPPGHHAFGAHAEGFCLINNAAVAAAHAIAHHKLGRVMILDWDVHHGNGTQHIFYEDPRLLYVSTHQWGIYPGSGHFEEAGIGSGRGSTLNVPLPSGADDEIFTRVFDSIILPKALAFKPQLLIVSAGFDAHWRDPLAHHNLSLRGFGALTRRVLDLAGELCGGRLVAVLEGGYDFDALGHGVCNMLWQMGGGAEADLPDPLGLPAVNRAPDVDNLLGRIRALHVI